MELAKKASFCDQSHIFVCAAAVEMEEAGGPKPWGITQMSKKPQQPVVTACTSKATPSERLRVVRDLNARKNGIQDITEALISSGYTSLDRQAKALGLHRTTTWTIIKNKHKLGRLSTKTIERIIANPETPPLVRSAVQEYVAEKTRDGEYSLDEHN